MVRAPLGDAGMSVADGGSRSPGKAVVVRTKPRTADAGAPSGFRIDAVAVRRVFRHGAPDVEVLPAVDESGASVGVALRGIGKYGVGLRDGDVVTSVDGRPVRDLESGVLAASAALQRGAPEVSGVLLRDGRYVPVVVAVPSEFLGDAGSRGAFDGPGVAR
ncbi:MAG: hypothetical protein U0169_03410 [Polyangiaceae bacterium]